MGKKILGREPALWIGVIGAAVTAVASLGLGFLSAGQGAALVAFVTAVIIAWATEPKAPALFTGAFAALVALVSDYGIGLSDDLVAAVTGLIVAVCALIGIRPQVSPKETFLSAA